MNPEIPPVMSVELVLPAVVLAALGWIVPRILARRWPEGVGWLMGLAFVSAVVMVGLGTVVFGVIYAVQGVDLPDLFATGELSVVVHFVKLSVMSALLWAPLMVLSVVGVPKGWVREVW